MMMLTEDEIKHRAASLLAEAGLEASFPLPVERIAAYLGYECHFYIPDEDIQDIAGAVSHLKRKIYVNQKNTLLQQRLSIARKLGRIVLHGSHQDYIDYLHATNDPHEEGVAYFAENLLMPEAIFRQQWIELKQDIKQLVEFFGVSQFQILARASVLGLR